MTGAKDRALLIAVVIACLFAIACVALEVKLTP